MKWELSLVRGFALAFVFSCLVLESTPVPVPVPFHARAGLGSFQFEDGRSMTNPRAQDWFQAGRINLHTQYLMKLTRGTGLSAIVCVDRLQGCRRCPMIVLGPVTSIGIISGRASAEEVVEVQSQGFTSVPNGSTLVDIENSKAVSRKQNKTRGSSGNTRVFISRRRMGRHTMAETSPHEWGCLPQMALPRPWLGNTLSQHERKSREQLVMRVL
ncbi:MAG: hypothetical protein J3Q66DRAFT_367360 [Benniella sp.]|nr:MAG: hypothetical protein J3Q66DRAFT_367360 [Benniella sp.]